MQLRIISLALTVLATCVTAALAGAPAASAQTSAQPTPQAPSVSITECTVFSESDANIRHDCTAVAKGLCAKAAANRCELPIGLVLTDGRDLDGNADTWEKVLVRYRCGSADRINGPHHQNDHASMILECRGG